MKLFQRNKPTKETTMSDVIIPSLPGFHSIRFMPLPGKVTPISIKEQARVYPRIGWTILEEARIPITPHDAPVEGEMCALLFPSGMVLDADGRQHKGIDAWATAVAEAWRSKQPPAHGPAFAIGPIPQPTSAWG
jgi:hypothetical protein